MQHAYVHTINARIYVYNVYARLRVCYDPEYAYIHALMIATFNTCGLAVVRRVTGALREHIPLPRQIMSIVVIGIRIKMTSKIYWGLPCPKVHL